MARHIHIHLGPRGTSTIGDEFNESDHPRASNGQFGSGGGGGGKGKGSSGSGAKSKPPEAPSLSGPKSKAAIAEIKAAAAKGDWRAVANVNVLGTHPQVHAYREAMGKYLESNKGAFEGATGKKE